MGQRDLDSERLLDETGWRILRELQEGARVTLSELGRRVALTPPAVAERIRRMEETGLITGYRAEVDLERLGLPITAFIRWTAGRGTDCKSLGDVTQDIPEVLECHRVTGEESYMVKVAVRSVEHLQDLIDRMMPYGETTTSIVLSSPVTNRVVGPPEELFEDQPPQPADSPRRRTAS
ncbi:MAG: Lrp/AsnC family transcriptional regulator [Actinomycetota bacterium]|nr:Lrp/AsnC family transcriptional regulator [Actinomycetota bacterium]